MTRFAVNTAMITSDDETVADGIAAAAELGVEAIEFFDWEGADLDAVRAASAEHGIDVAAVLAAGGGANIGDPDAPAMVDPTDHDTVVADIERSLEATAEVDGDSLILTVGPDRPGLGRDTQRRALEDVLAAIAPTAESVGVTAVVEPLNTSVDHPGYFLRSSQAAFDVVRAVGSDRVAVLFDVYHQQITEGDVIRGLTENVADVGHVHIADNPGRHEPGSGEIAYPNVLTALHDAGYEGFVGMEFFAASDDATMHEAVRATTDLG